MRSMTLFIGCMLVCSYGCSGTKSTNEWKTISSNSQQQGGSVNGRQSDLKTGGFVDHLPEGFAVPSDNVGRRLLNEYGAMFVARGGAVPPSVVVFPDEAGVSAFQKSVKSSTESIGGVSIQLQEPAMKALKEAVAEAAGSGESITPRGEDAAKRDYQGTVTNWTSRVEPGLTHWTGRGRLSEEDARRIRALSPFDQVPEIFKLEEKGMFFAKDLSKSIIYSVAPPGASQHLSMLALDVAEHDKSRVRGILAKHGWYQTVISDLPHFTYLGVTEAELPSLGLKRVIDGGRVYWVPGT